MKRRVGLFHAHGYDSDTGPALARMRMAGWFGRTAACVLMALVVAACGSSAASAAPTAAGGGPGGASSAAPTSGPATPAGSVAAPGGGVPADPCSLLTQAEVSAALGVSVGAGSSAGDPRSCEWMGATANAIVTINVGTTFSSLCGAPSNAAAGIKIVQVSGVGDGACYIETTLLGLGTNLTFEKGGQVYSLAVNLTAQTTTAAAEAAEKTLSLGALAKL